MPQHATCEEHREIKAYTHTLQHSSIINTEKGYQEVFSRLFPLNWIKREIRQRRSIPLTQQGTQQFGYIIMSQAGEQMDSHLTTVIIPVYILCYTPLLLLLSGSGAC